MYIMKGKDPNYIFGGNFMYHNLKKFNKIIGVCELVALVAIATYQGWTYGYKAGYDDKSTEEL